MRVIGMALALGLLAGVASAQGTAVDLGGLQADPSAPVEVVADQLTVDRETGRAVFSGNVAIAQGALRITAQQVEVVYDETTGDIARLTATGGVTFVTETEAAEAQSAVYDLTAGVLTLTGGVLMTQGASALAANAMTVNLETGEARMEGRVRTVFAQDN